MSDVNIIINKIIGFYDYLMRHEDYKVPLSNFAEIKTVCSPRSIDVSTDLMNLYLDYIAELHTENVDTNYVLIKLSGENKGKPLVAAAAGYSVFRQDNIFSEEL